MQKYANGNTFFLQIQSLFVSPMGYHAENPDVKDKYKITIFDIVIENGNLIQIRGLMEYINGLLAFARDPCALRGLPNKQRSI